jgi:hypothetical protein
VRGRSTRDAEASGQPQHHRVAGLHVAGAAAVEPAVLQPAGHVVGDRHGVEVTGEDDAGGSAEVRPGEDGVADPLDLETAERPQRRLDRVGQGPLAARHRRDVDQRTGERQDVGGGVQRGQVAHDSRAYGRAPGRAAAAHGRSPAVHPGVVVLCPLPWAEHERARRCPSGVRTVPERRDRRWVASSP